MSTDTPRLQKPCSSGGLTMIKRHVDRQPPGAEHLGDLREEDRRVVGPDLSHGVAHAVADEERIGAEPIGVLRVGVRRHAHRQHVQHFGVFRTAGGIHQRPHQFLRFAAGRSDEHAVTRSDVLDRCFGRDHFLLPRFAPVRLHSWETPVGT